MKKSIYLNTIISFICQIIITVFAIFLPRIYLINYGSDVNGVLTTVTQIFVYLALLESGIGNATKNLLYKPISGNNENDISKIMSLSKKYFIKASNIYLICVIGLALIFPFLIKSELNYFVIFFVVIFEGFAGFISLRYIRKWYCFLIADGKNYVINIFELITKILNYTIKIIFSMLAFNIAIVQFVSFTTMCFSLLCYYIYMKKKYGWINYSIDVKNSKLLDHKSYTINEIAWTIFSSTDLIILSIFVSSKMSSVYSTYNMIFSTLSSLLNTLYASLLYILGRYYQKGINEYIKMHDTFNTLFVSLITVFMSVAYILILPFMKLYTSGVDDVEYINFLYPIFFGAIQILSWSRYVANDTCMLSGHVKAVSKVSIVESIINILVSLILVSNFGIMGVLIGTIVALPLKVIVLNYIVDKKVFKRTPLKTILILSINYIIFIATIIVNQYFKIEINNYLLFVLYGAIIFVGYLLITLILNIIINKDIFKTLKLLIKGKKE